MTSVSQYRTFFLDISLLSFSISLQSRVAQADLGNFINVADLS